MCEDDQVTLSPEEIISDKIVNYCQGCLFYFIIVDESRISINNPHQDKYDTSVSFFLSSCQQQNGIINGTIEMVMPKGHGEIHSFSANMTNEEITFKKKN